MKFLAGLVVTAVCAAVAVVGSSPAAPTLAAADGSVIDFESTEPGDNPQGWYDSGSGNSLSEDPALFNVAEVDGTRALSTTSAATNVHSHYLATSSPDQPATSLTGRMRISAPSSGIGVTILSDYPSSDSYYRLRRYGSGAFEISPHGTTITGGTTNTGVVPVANTWYDFRLEVEDQGDRTSIRARVWPSGSPEPTDWQVDAYDAGPQRRTTGTFGVWSMGAGTKFWDDFTTVLMPEPGPHTLTLTSAGAGTVEATPDAGDHPHGSSVQVTATPEPGWRFSGWSGDAAGTENPLAISMLGDTTVTATFVEQVPVSLSVETTGDGSVAVDPDASDYFVGDVVTLTASAAEGQVFTGWTGATTSTDNSLVLELVGDTTIAASFAPAPPTLVSDDFESYEPGQNPSAWVDTRSNNSMATDDSLFAISDVAGTRAFGTASTASNIHSHYLPTGTDPSGDYEVTGRMLVTDGAGGVGITVLSDYTESDAYYRLRRYGSTGAFELSPHGTTITGTTRSTVVPVAGNWYRFRIEASDSGSGTSVRAKVWTDGAPEPDQWQMSATDESTSRRVTGAVGMWAHGPGSKYIDDIQVTPLSVTQTPTFAVETSVVGEGSVTTDPEQSVYEPGSAVELTAVPSTGWQFAGWSGAATGTTNPITITLEADVAVTATFTEVPAEMYGLESLVVGGGTIERTPDSTEYPAGSAVRLTAVADTGWRFVGWSGDISAGTQSVDVVVESNMSVTATFEPATLRNIAVATVGEGTTTIDPSVGPYHDDDPLTISASAANGWIFDRWEVDPPASLSWWDDRWTYRVPVDVSTVGIERNDVSVEFDVDFTAAWADIGVVDELDVESIRVVEIDGAGTVVGMPPHQFDPSSDFDATANAHGRLTFQLEGSTPGDATRRYHVYFDSTSAGHVPAAMNDAVDVVENVTDAGETTIRIATPSATYFYDRDGGGFTSIVDRDGNDWISYGSAPGSAGQYRGIPNAVYPEGIMHPGAAGVTTSVVHDGPVRSTIRSVSADGSWEHIWDIFPTHARLTVVAAEHSYWFLYEGTPGGEFDAGTDLVMRSNGAVTSAGTSWTGDLPGDEWVAFGDPGDGRSLFLANHASDQAVDSYYPMDGNMTVFGFGRNGLNSYLTTTPAQFSLGLVDDVTIDGVASHAVSSMRPVGLGVGAVETSAPRANFDDPTISVDVSADHVYTAVFTEAPAPALVLVADGEGTISADPSGPGYQFGAAVSVTAAPAAGWEFVGWTGDATGASNPLSITLEGDTTITATFRPEDADAPVIDVWYGDEQSYGGVGIPQPYYNVVGNVSDPDGVASLSYSLNGGPSTTLSIGTDNRRLANPGDFNVDLVEAALVDGTNEVVITATDTLGNSRSQSVTVEYTDRVWPTSYTADWSATTEIGSVAQVVDGEWALTPDGVRTTDPDYDRLIAIGDTSWTDYEIEVPITIHALDAEGFRSPESAGAGIGLLMRWNGHTEMPIYGYQPKTGWLPYGAIGWYWWNSPGAGSLRIDGNYGQVLDERLAPVSVGGSYVYKMRVETIVGVGGRYSLKVWPAGGTEPSTWTLVAQEDMTDPQNGSLMLLAHHVDATFGDVTIRPLAGPGPHTLDVDTIGNGSVDAVPAATEYPHGEVVSLSAVADEGWVFAGWSGDVSGTANPVSVTMDTAKSVTATFVSGSEPPVISGVEVSAGVESAVVSWVTDRPASSSVEFGETTSFELGTVSDSTLRTEHSVTLSGLSPGTTYHFRVSSTGEGGDSASSPESTFVTRTVDQDAFVSDDFNDCAVAPMWSFVNPLGDGTATSNGTQLLLSVPGGVAHDVWAGGNMAPRVMQEVGDDDVGIEVGFESAVTDSYEMQGIIAEQDAGNYLRFDTYGHAGQTYVFVARFVNGQPTTIANVAVGTPSTTDPSAGLRVTRTGDTWTMDYRLDGSGWITATSFVHAMTLTQLGVFAGNAGAAPAHTAIIDYAFNTATPINPEDADTHELVLATEGSGTILSDPDQSTFACDEVVSLSAVADEGWVFAGWSGDVSGTANPVSVTMDTAKSVTATFVSGSEPPVISGVEVSAGVESAVVSWVTDRPASSSVEFGETTSFELGTVSDSTLRTEHSVTLSGLSPGTTYHFRVSSTGEGGDSASSPESTFVTRTVDQDAFVSDDFNDCAVAPMWSFVNPLGDGTATSNGTQLLLSVPGGVAHDVWAGGNMAPRVMQEVGDDDVGIEVGFESAVTDSYEMQGIIAEQDAGNYLRFDTYGHAGQTYVFVARFVNGQPTTIANVAVGTPSTTDPSAGLRVTRTGDTWTMDYRLDGSGWITATSFVHAMTLTQLGVFAGNAGAAPAHTAIIDYAFNTATPINPEDADDVSC